MKGEGLEPLKRPLTQHEQELVLWLIEHGTYADRQRLKSQLELLSVWERCTCGCPTVYFAYEGVPVPRKGERVVSDHVAVVNDSEFGVMLFANDGLLSSLEVYSASGLEGSFGLPPIGSIRPFA